jgi:hypothetical protein
MKDRDHYTNSKDLFKDQSNEDKEFIMEIVANFHYRTGFLNPDGSLGIIKITPGELNDILSYSLMRYKK